MTSALSEGPRRAPEGFAFDLEKLLAPISVEHPAGEWLRDQPVYDAIQEARREEDADLPRGVWERELKRAEWGEVEALCLEALETRTKDAQVAAWLMESWIRLHGFAGAAAGLKLLAALYDAFWDDLYPPLEGDDAEYRLAPLAWLDQHLSLELKRVPVTAPGSGEAPVYGWGDWESALHLNHIAAEDRKALETAEARGRVTREKFLASVTLTPSSFYLELGEQVARSRTALDELAAVVGARRGDDLPSLVRFRDTLAAIGHFARQVLAERMEEAPEASAEPAPETPWPPEEEPAEPLFAGGPIGNRAEAYRRLSEAADFLLRTEPHSPTPYLVRRAVSWGGMTLTELLAELLADNADLKTVYKLLGLRKPEGAGA